jgi:hypothetical protein
MKRKRILPLTISELEALHTKQLLARLTRLHQCEESFDLSNRTGSDDSEFIEFKQTSEWLTAFTDVKQILSQREHVPKISILARIKTAKEHQGNSDRTAKKLLPKK